MSWKQKRSHYAALDVSTSSTQKEIKDSFIRLSKQFHPDLQPDNQVEQATERFQKIAEAYEVLGDPARKKEYDASLGLSRKPPLHSAKANAHDNEYDEAGKL